MDQRGSSVMVWKGKQASKMERQEALNRAVVRVLTDGARPVEFGFAVFAHSPLSIRVTSKQRTTRPAPAWR